MKNRKLANLSPKGLFTLFLLTALVGLLGYFLPQHWQIHTQEVQFTNRYGTPLRARLYHPEDSQQAYSALILCQGISSNKELLHIFALEMAHLNRWVLVPDWHGQGESGVSVAEAAVDDFEADLQASLLYLTQRGISPQNIALSGHSMGATLAVNTAQKYPVRAVIAYGMDSTGTVPNLLLGSGWFDEFYPASRVQSAFTNLLQREQRSLDKLPGDFQTGEARKFFLLPVSHTLESLQPALMQPVHDWLALAFGKKSELQVSWQPNRVLFFGLLLWGMLGMIVMSLSYILEQSHKPRLLTAVVALFSLMLLPLVNAKLPLLWAANMALLAWLSVGITNGLYQMRKSNASQPIHQQTGQFFIYLALIYGWGALTYSLVLIGNARSALSLIPQLEWVIPEFMGPFILSQPWIVCQGIRPWLFTAYSTHVSPSLLFYGLWLLELAWPGGLCALYTRYQSSRQKTEPFSG